MKRRFPNIAMSTMAFLVIAGPALEISYAGIYRHLTPFYLSAIFFFLFDPPSPWRRVSVARLPVWLLLVAVLGCLLVAMTMFSVNIEDGLADAARIWYIFFTIGFVWRLNMGENEKRWALLGLALGSLVFLYLLVGENVMELASPLRLSQILNRNLTGSVTLTALLGTIYHYSMIERTNTVTRVLLVLVSMVLGYFTVVSYSRSITLVGILALVVLFVSKVRNVRLKVLIALMGLFSAYLANEIPDYGGSLQLDKLRNIEEFSSGRTDIWAGALDKLPDTHIFGSGTANTAVVLGESREYLRSRYGQSHPYMRSAHSLPLKLLIENGILGIGLYTGFAFGMLRFSWRIRKISFFPMASAIFCIGFTLFHDYSLAPWILFAITLPMKELRRSEIHLNPKGWFGIPPPSRIRKDS